MGEQTKDGGPAYPGATAHGLTLRDRFAIEAMKLMAWHIDAAAAAKATYAVADAMIKAREQSDADR